jgi:hypothetical protein
VRNAPDSLFVIPRRPVATAELDGLPARVNRTKALRTLGRTDCLQRV